tara:strand:+ start:1090 stop:1248 length:159 start_codon:yes stop_codon:yes gene_type:complete
MTEVIGFVVTSDEHKTYVQLPDHTEPFYIDHPNATNREVKALIDGYFQGLCK